MSVQWTNSGHKAYTGHHILAVCIWSFAVVLPFIGLCVFQFRLKMFLFFSCQMELEALRSIYEGDECFRELSPVSFQYRVRLYETILAKSNGLLVSNVYWFVLFLWKRYGCIWDDWNRGCCCGKEEKYLYRCTNVVQKHPLCLKEKDSKWKDLLTYCNNQSCSCGVVYGRSTKAHNFSKNNFQD